MARAPEPSSTTRMPRTRFISLAQRDLGVVARVALRPVLVRRRLPDRAPLDCPGAAVALVQRDGARAVEERDDRVLDGPARNQRVDLRGKVDVRRRTAAAAERVVDAGMAEVV